MTGVQTCALPICGFGPLEDPEIPRVVVLGLSLIVISLQSFFSAFLLGVLEIPVKRLKAAQARPAESAVSAEK